MLQRKENNFLKLKIYYKITYFKGQEIHFGEKQKKNYFKYTLDNTFMAYI